MPLQSSNTPGRNARAERRLRRSNPPRESRGTQIALAVGFVAMMMLCLLVTISLGNLLISVLTLAAAAFLGLLLARRYNVGLLMAFVLIALMLVVSLRLYGDVLPSFG